MQRVERRLDAGQTLRPAGEFAAVLRFGTHQPSRAIGPGPGAQALQRLAAELAPVTLEAGGVDGFDETVEFGT